MSYDNIKSHKKQSFNLSLENTVLEKPKEVGLECPPPPAFLGLSLLEMGLFTKDRKTSDLSKITVGRKCCTVSYVPDWARIKPDSIFWLQ